MWNEGHCKEVIANNFDCSVTTVYMITKKHGRGRRCKK